MTPSFDLLEQPWIPCVWPEGRREPLGLREALTRAHEVIEIRDDSPLVTVSLHRLLLAVLHRVFGPEDLDAWAAIWTAGQFDGADIDGYFEQWRGRFDLFDPERPFYQTGRMQTKEPLPPVALFDQCASGNNPILFDHSSDGCQQGLSPGVAARGLIARQAISIGFGKSPAATIAGEKVSTGYRSDAPLTRGVSVLVEGRNLFETLACNLSYRGEGAEADCPVWEQDRPERLMGQTYPNGRLDLYTWQSRRLRLVLDDAEEPRVTGVHFAQGRKLEDAGLDPMKPCRKGDKGWEPIPIRPERAIWRDSATLLQSAHQDETRHSALHWLRLLADRQVVEPELETSLAAFGLSTAPGKAGSVLLWRHETLPLPLPYVREPDLVALLGHEIAAAEAAAAALTRATKRVAEIAFQASDGQRADPDRVTQFANSVAPTRAFWPRVERCFRRLVVDLARTSAETAAKQDSCIDRWHEALRSDARAVFTAIAGNLEDSPRMLKAIHQSDGGWSVLNRGLSILSSIQSQGEQDG